MRNGSAPTTTTPANAAAARPKLWRPPRLVISIAAKNGIATSANCFSSTAAARQAAAQTNRERLASPNARTRKKRLGASAVPNHAACTTSGFAASAAPTARRRVSGPAKESAAGISPSVASRTRKR